MKTITVAADGHWEIKPDVEYYESLEWYDDERSSWFSPYVDLGDDCGRD